jgi:hypothetical protein
MKRSEEEGISSRNSSLVNRVPQQPYGTAIFSLCCGAHAILLDLALLGVHYGLDPPAYCQICGGQRGDWLRGVPLSEYDAGAAPMAWSLTRMDPMKTCKRNLPSEQEACSRSRVNQTNHHQHWVGEVIGEANKERHPNSSDQGLILGQLPP